MRLGPSKFARKSKKETIEILINDIFEKINKKEDSSDLQKKDAVIMFESKIYFKEMRRN